MIKSCGVFGSLYFMPQNVLSILKSAMAVTLVAPMVTLAGKAKFLVLSFCDDFFYL
jgi:hypothetical protein